MCFLSDRAPGEEPARLHRAATRGSLDPAIPYWLDGAADVAETPYVPFRHRRGALPARLIVRRVRPTPGSQLALLADYSYHAFVSDREGDLLYLEQDHRRHAEVEHAIRDL